MGWTSRTPTGIRNVHSRLTAGPPEAAAALLQGIAEPGNPLWPTDRWPPLVLDRGLATGSAGGHGPIRYRVETSAPGTITFGFDADDLVGRHTFTLAGEGSGVRWTHELIIEAPDLLTRLVVVPLHDQLLEDLLDGAEAAMAGTPVRRTPFRMGVRARRWLVDRLAPAAPETAAL